MNPNCASCALVSAEGSTFNSTSAGPVAPWPQLAFKSSITNGFTGTPVVVVDGAEKELEKVPQLIPTQREASYGKFASAETVATGFALVLVTCTIVAATPRAARGARA